MTISHPAPPLEDVRVVAARKALAELPDAEDNESPYFWLGRLKASLTALLAAWPRGARGGLDSGQREVLGAALSDAIRYRDPVGDATSASAARPGCATTTPPIWICATPICTWPASSGSRSTSEGRPAGRPRPGDPGPV